MKERISWVDNAKGIGIILVIIGHSICPAYAKGWLYTFHMPLFFFLSGITFNYNKYKDFKLLLRARVKTLIVPYVILSAIYFMYKMVQVIILKSDFNLIKEFIGIFIQIRTTQYDAGLWFIPCIFISEILLLLILKISKDKTKVYLPLALLTLVSGYLYCTIIDVKLPWGIDAALIAVSFMVLGYALKDKTRYMNKLYILFLIPNIIIGYLNVRRCGVIIDMWSNKYGSLLLFATSALCGIIFTVVISQMINIKLLGFIGRNSLYYYGLHLIVIDVISKVARRVGITTNGFIKESIIAFVTLIIVILMLNKIPEIMNKKIRQLVN